MLHRSNRIHKSEYWVYLCMFHLYNGTGFNTQVLELEIQNMDADDAVMKNRSRSAEAWKASLSRGAQASQIYPLCLESRNDVFLPSFPPLLMCSQHPCTCQQIGAIMSRCCHARQMRSDNTHLTIPIWWGVLSGTAYSQTMRPSDWFSAM